MKRLFLIASLIFGYCLVTVFMVLVLSSTRNPVDDIRKLPVVETMEVTDISALCKGKVIDMADFPSPDFGIELNDGSGYRKYLSTQRSGNVFGVVFNNLKFNRRFFGEKQFDRLVLAAVAYQSDFRTKTY